MLMISGIFRTAIGSISQAFQSLSSKASRISQLSHSEEAQHNLPEDLVGMEIDKAQVKANMRVVRIADEVLQELVQDRLKK